MINFYSFYNKTGLDKEDYAPLISQLKKGDYTKELESITHIIKVTPKYGYRYAINVLKCRWPEAEQYIMKDPYYIYLYARYVMHERWFEAEPYIMKDPYKAYQYARDILKGRWPEAEEFIKQYEMLWHQYCKNME